MEESRVLEIEFNLFLETMALRHGYDFRHYARASIRRRILALAQAAGCKSIGQLLPRVLREEGFLKFALSYLSVPVTELFRDPSVFASLRREVLPLLASYPRINIWLAGCATGEEAVTLAILLHEEQLLHKAQIYATDINDEALDKAEQGIYTADVLEAGAKKYRQAGGKASIYDYFEASGGAFRTVGPIRERISYAHHDLVGDGVFCEVSLVVCRNVLIYFDHQLQHTVISRFADSLSRGGFLCIGPRESLHASDQAKFFKVIDAECRIFKKQGFSS